MQLTTKPPPSTNSNSLQVKRVLFFFGSMFNSAIITFILKFHLMALVYFSLILLSPGLYDNFAKQTGSLTFPDVFG